MTSPASEPKASNKSFDREAYHKAAAHTLASLHQVIPPAELTRFSNRPTAEVEALQEQVAQVIPAGNIVGLVLGGLIRVRGRTLPAEQAKSDVTALLRGIEMLPRHILPSTLYGTFFVGPAAVLAGYQKILTLAGKDPDSAFPDGLWQFYLEFALREDSARHTNETTHFHSASAEYELNLSQVDQLAAWVCAVSQVYFQYDDLLYNEWRERVYLNLLEQAAEAAQQSRVLAFRQLPQAWATQRPYRRGHDAAPDENYAAYRRRRFDKFLQNRLGALPLVQRNWVQETYTNRLEHELEAYQRQMTILATLDPDRYRENRLPLPLWQTRIGIIYQDCYYLLPPCHTDALGQPLLFQTRLADSGGQVLQTSAKGELLDQAGRALQTDRTGRVYETEGGRTRGYLHPIPFQAVRRHVAAIFQHHRVNGASRSPAAQLDHQLICIRRSEQERARKAIQNPLARQELIALKCAPVLINWTEQASTQPLAYIRQGKRGIGDHALTIFRTDHSMVFDQSHIFFDGTWGMALAEVLTNEAVAWATYFNELPPLEPAPNLPYSLHLAAEPGLEKLIKSVVVEVSAENTDIDLKALYALRKLLSKRHPDLKTVNTVNDLLLLFRCYFGQLYRPSTEIEDALFELRALNTAATTAVYELINEMLAHSQASNPSIMMPMDASAVSPRERLCPTTFRNPFNQLWARYENASTALGHYNQQQTATAWAIFSDARYSLLVQLDHFGQLLRAHKRVALEGESTSLATMKLMAHLPDSLLSLLDQIPRRIDVLNEVIKGEEVFSNVGRVARGSSLSRFISAKDDNENKTLVWGFLTDDRDVLHLSLRDFRPHVAALQQLGKIDLAEIMLKHYLDSFAQGFNQFVARLLDILDATATHTSHGVHRMSFGTDPFIGAKLGSYEILEAIGEGGMARIYKGFHAELNRYTAIKVVNWGLQEDPEFTERFRREAQAIAILRHPNIVQIFDFGKHTSGYFMVMEFIDGSDLQVQLRGHRDKQELLPKDKVIRVIRDVAAALDYAHSRGVIHRDVKPSNIMITREGQPILTDFGLVMLPAHKSQVTIGNTFGTPHYVAPEQAISSAAAVAASDIYSLGVILYEMATGQLPFDDDSPLSVALKHISDPPPAPTSINPNLPADVEDVILQALSKDPTDRFATAGDMASALEMSWSSKSAAGRDRKAPTMLPAGVPPAAVVPSITLPTAAAVAPVAIAIEPATPQPTQSRSKTSLLPAWWPLAVGAVAVVLVGSWGFFSFLNPSSAQPAATPTTVTVAFATDEATATSRVAVVATATLTPEPPTLIPTEPPTATSSPTNPPPLTDTPPPTATLTPTTAPTATPTHTPTPEPSPTPTPPPTDTPVPPTNTPVPPPAPTDTVVVNGPLTLEQLKGKILFKTDRAGYVQIYRMDADGSNQLPFDNASQYAQLEADLPFSANKQEKMVVRGEGQLDLWRANLTTGQELRVTSTGKPEYDPAWSPVDNRIAYVSEETGNGDIYMLNLDGSAVERLTVNTDNFDKHPTWSPDGTKIAYWSDMGFNKTRQIWVIDLPSRVVRSLSDNPYNDWDPVWVR